MKLKFLLLLLILNVYSFCSDTSPTSISIETNVSSLVDGCVNAITGDFIDSSNDLVVVGPEALVFERFSSSSDYIINNFCSGWRHNHDCWVHKRREKSKKDSEPDLIHLTYVETNGRVTSLTGKEYDNSTHVSCRLDLEGSNLGLTNCGSGFISAMTNPKNSHLQYNYGNISTALQNGSILYFNDYSRFDVYDLSIERKASTRHLVYNYKKHQITDVHLTGADQNNILSSLHFEIDQNKFMKISTSDGQEVMYKLERGKSTKVDEKNHISKRYLLKEVIRFGEPLPSDTYEYVEREVTGGNMISGHYKRDGRYKKIKYYSKEDNLEKRDFRINQVHYLTAPVGADNGAMTTYQFNYFADSFTYDNHDVKSARSGHTEVYDANLYKTTYHFKNKRLTAIEKFSGVNGTALFSRENYHWGKEDSPNAFNLISRCIQDSKGKYLVARVFDYDPKGNILVDRQYGEITGHGQPLLWNGMQHPHKNDCERYTHQYTYSNDKLNLLLTDTEDNGKATHYIYHYKTNLLAKKLVIDHNQKKIVQRTFHEYDKNGVLIKTVFDNGSSSEIDHFNNVTVRRITYTFPRMTAPVGVPERTDEMYLDLATGQEVLLTRTCRQFSPQGKLLKEDFYDANGVYGYSLTKKYDARGNIIEESDERGNITYRVYDDNNNLIAERKPGELHLTLHSYDYSNRLINTKELHDNGTLLVTSHRYSPIGTCLATVDPFGNTTEYQYDEFKQVIRTTKTAIPDAEGNLRKTTTAQQYDILGNVILAVNEEGEATHTTYNIHGKPLVVKYPDGSQDKFQYNLDGTLKRHYPRDGTFIVYQKDIFDRVTKKEIFTHEGGSLLSQESFVFNGLHLLSKTDAEGKVTNYRYDGAGRLSSMEDGSHLTTYAYDSFGRLSQTKEWYDEDHCKTTSILHNTSGQVIEEKVTEGDKLFKHQSFVYDMQGNVVVHTEFNQAGEASSTYTEYNWHKQPKKITDALGNVTVFRYDYKARDSYGIQVLATTVTDALGNTSITTHNGQGKIASLVKKNAMGEMIAKKEFFYKGTGDLYFTRETAIAANAPDRIINTRWTIDYFHQVHDLVEAEGTPEQKHTHFDYNSRGHKIAQTKPDGTIIHCTYDGKGRLEHQYASDGSFDYQYTFNHTDKVIAIQNLVNNIVTERNYDFQGNLEEERLGNGLVLKYRYDRLNRPIKVTLPDESSIQYSYDACNLKEIQRGQHKFAYQDFHLVAHPKVIALPANAGKLYAEYDLMGRPQKVMGGDIVEEVHYDCVGNLIRADMHSNLTDELCEYAYDDLYQLKSESGFATHSYQNDSLYNCINRDGKIRVFNALHQLIQEGDAHYKYDANGNLICQEINGEKTLYQYDALDRLISVQKEDEFTQYTYDAFHRRLLKKQANGEVVRYIYQGENEVGACDENDRIFQLRVLGIGKGAEIGASLAFELDGEIFYPVHDHNGNVLALLDNQGVTRENYRYSAFGEAKIFDLNGEPVLDSSFNNPWRFSSKRHDEESGLVYFGRRYYDPTACRWISPDPLGFDAGPNLYAYVMNSPLSHVDLYGLIASGNESARIGFFPMIFQALQTGLSYCREVAGRSIETAGLHFIPVPLVSNVIQSCGRFIAGDPLTYQSSYDQDHPENFRVGSVPNGSVNYMLIPGMNNMYKDSKDLGTELSDNIGEEIVQVAHGGSHGSAADLFGIGKIKAECCSEIVKSAVRGIKMAIAALPKDGILHILAHSRGALVLFKALKYLTIDERAKLFASTCGGAKIIDQKEWGLLGARNHVSWFDPIPFLSDPIGCIKGLFSSYGNTQFYKGKVPFLDHSFNGEIYKDCTMKDIGIVKDMARERR